MAEPPTKKPRRMDNSAGDKHGKTSVNGDAPPTRRGDQRPGDDKKKADRSERRDEGRPRSRERGHERTDSKSERSREKDRPRDKGGRDERERDRARRDDTRLDRPRSRSRSPPRGERRPGVDRRRTPPRSPASANNKDRGDSNRTRSPPRGPRNDRDRAGDDHKHTASRTDRPRAARATHSTKPNGASVNGENARDKMDVDSSSDESGDDLEKKMMKVMGFGKFKSTKNTKVPGNDKLYGVRKEKKAEYRQYMNRVGGFNRPLSPS